MSARLERVDQDLETWRMARELEQPHDANNAKELEYVVILLNVIEQEVQIKTERRNEVDDVDRSENEVALARTDDKPNAMPVHFSSNTAIYTARRN